MPTRRIFDGATIEIGQVPIVGAAPPPPAATIVWLKVAGVWKQATAFLKVTGTWKTTTPYIKVSGNWK
jgi:hypothetical protein